MNIIQDQSPNKSTGRAGVTISDITLHSTYGSYWGSVAWLKNPSAKVSANYIISAEGEIRRLVAEQDTPWSDGNLASNRRSISIEVTDNKQKTITEKAKAALIWLVADIKKRHNIKVIKFHRDVTATACPYLDIKKEWFDNPDPLQECLRLHGERVKEVEDLKRQVTELKATEKRLIAEKDQAIKEKETIIGNLQHELDAKQALLKTEQDANAEKKETIKKLEEDVREFNLALSTMQAERDEALAQKVKAENEATGMVAEVTELRQLLEEAKSELASKPIPYKKLYEEAKLEVEKLTEKMNKDMIPYAKHKILKALQQVAYDLDTRLQALK